MRISDWRSDVCSSDLKLDLHVLESEILVDLHRLGVEVGDLGLDLVLGAEHVAVVLGEAAHAQDPMQRTGRFVALARPELAVAARLVAVSVQAVVEPLDVAGAGCRVDRVGPRRGHGRSEEQTSELQSLMRSSYAVFCLTTKK